MVDYGAERLRAEQERLAEEYWREYTRALLGRLRKWGVGVMGLCRWNCKRETGNRSGICDDCWRAAESLRANSDEGAKAWAKAWAEGAERVKAKKQSFHPSTMAEFSPERLVGGAN